MTLRGHSSVVGVLALAGVLVSLQSTVVVPLVAKLPEIFDVGAVQASWIVTSTLLAGALATPIVGRLADMYGKRRMVMVTLVLMVTGSVLLAVTHTWLLGVAGRALHGFAAALLPVAISILKDVLPPERVGSGIALVSATLGIGGAIGLPTAGVLYGLVGWSAMFWVTAGLGLVVAVVARLVLPAGPRALGERFDFPGALLLLLGLTPLLLVIVQGNVWGWTSPRIAVLGTLAVVMLVAWVPWELRARHPLVNMRLAARRPVILTNVASLVIAMGMLANLLLAASQLGTPDSVEGGFGLSAGATGLATAAPAAVIVCASPVVGRLLGRFGGRRVLVLGATVMSAAYVARVFLDASVAQVVMGSVLVGVGTSLALSAMPMIIMGAVPSGHTASANGLNAFCRMVGTAISTAGIAALATATAVVVHGQEYPSVQTNHTAFWLCAAATLAAAILAWFIPRCATREVGLVAPTTIEYGKRSNSLLHAGGETRG